MSPSSRAWLQIHFCVVLWGFTAILGKLITLTALAIVWWRMLLVSAALLLVPRFWSGLSRLQPRQIAIYAGIGALVAVHWFGFYASIKLSNASVAATCMALTPVFISFIEPFVVRRRFEPRELLFALAVIPGVALVVGGTPGGMRPGIAIGVAAALLLAIFGSMNKRFIGSADALAVTGIEMGAGAVLVTLVLLIPASGLVDFPIIGLSPSETLFALPPPGDRLLVLLLAVGCTLLPFALSLVALRQLSAFSTALAVNMEPVYAIVLAIILLGEQHELSPGFYLGVAVIVAVVFLQPWLARRPTGKRIADSGWSEKSGALNLRSRPAIRYPPSAIRFPPTSSAAAADRPDRGRSGSA